MTETLLRLNRELNYLLDGGRTETSLRPRKGLLRGQVDEICPCPVSELCAL